MVDAEARGDEVVPVAEVARVLVVVWVVRVFLGRFKKEKVEVFMSKLNVDDLEDCRWVLVALAEVEWLADIREVALVAEVCKDEDDSERELDAAV